MIAENSNYDNKKEKLLADNNNNSQIEKLNKQEVFTKV